MMDLGFSSDAILGYCTNVHPGGSLDEIKLNLETHAVGVKRRVSPDAPMGIGLWFPFSAAVELMQDDGARRLRDWLGERGLFAYTLNGFPFGDFHQRVVKRAVYEPDWTDRRRYDYTLMLATILSELLPDDAEEGSISTLPLGWPHPPTSEAPKTPEVSFGITAAEKLARYDAQAEVAAGHLTDLVHQLARIELNTGKRIHVNLEPEPGCVIDTAPGMVKFFEDYLWGTVDEVSVRGYLGVCHDVCHSAMMFESQREALSAYQAAGLRVGKVQISSALRLPLDGMTGNERQYALGQLRPFAEGRYLHQTVIRRADGARAFYDDLPGALRGESAEPQGEWRVHFHVPVDRAALGVLGTTQGEIAELFKALGTLRDDDRPRHFEVETYAWDVLPAEMRPACLADGIAEELLWVMRTFGRGAGGTSGEISRGLPGGLPGAGGGVGDEG